MIANKSVNAGRDTKRQDLLKVIDSAADVPPLKVGNKCRCGVCRIASTCILQINRSCQQDSEYELHGIRLSFNIQLDRSIDSLQRLEM
jgi:hypothetical protein